MKKYVKIFALALALIMLLALAACSNGVDDTTNAASNDDTTAPEETKDLAGEEGDTYAEMDYMAEELSKYVTLGQYKGLSVEAIRPVVSDADIEAELQSIVDANTTYEPYDDHVTDRATMAGDYVNIDYVGTMDGEPFEGGSNEGDTVLLAENNGFIDWFEDDLYGVMPGTTVVSTGNFPENYHEHLAGKEVTFTITVNYIAGHYTIPELTDEFIKEKTGYETVEIYKNFLRETLQAEMDSEHEMSKFQKMWQAVLDNAEEVELPESQVMFYYTSERSYYETYAAQYGYTYEEFLEAVGVDDNYIVDMMKDRVKEEIVFYSIVKAENIEVTQEDYANGIIEYAASQGISESELVEQYGEDYIRECVLWDKVMVYLVSENTFIEE
jgi:trigger factor